MFRSVQFSSSAVNGALDSGTGLVAMRGFRVSGLSSVAVGPWYRESK